MTAQVTENLNATVWLADRPDTPLRWSVSRVQDGLRISDVLEMPLFIRTVAFGFSEAPHLSTRLREDLLALVAALDTVLKPSASKPNVYEFAGKVPTRNP